MRTRLIIILSVLQLLLCSICFANNTPQFDYLFTDRYGNEYYYDINNYDWITKNIEMGCVINVKLSTGDVYTEAHRVKQAGKYDCLIWSIHSSGEGTSFNDKSQSPIYEEVIDKDTYKMFNIIWNNLLSKR